MTGREGQTLKGKYRLDRVLGAGAMGEVYRARNVLVDRTVAIKILKEEFAANEQVVERFMREAKAANVVRHRNIVDVHDIDKTEDGLMFIVQEYLEGEDLAAHLEGLRGGLPPEAALDVLIPVVEAVGAAHLRGVVHRDLKPDNVFLSRDGDDVVPKVLDFGISKVPVQDSVRRTAPGAGPAPTNARLTAVGMAMGTPLYMSPEQIRDPGSVDPRGDVWSLGVMLYETLSGRVPFDAEDLAGLFALICSSEPTPLGRVAPGVPRDLAKVVHQCLRPERSERFNDATTLAERLRRCRLRLAEEAAAHRGESTHAPTMLSGPPPPMGGRGLGHDATEPAVQQRASKPAPQDFGLELDIPGATPAGPSPDRHGDDAQGSPSEAPEAPTRSTAPADPRASAGPAVGGSPFGVFDDDDDDAPALALELAEGEDPVSAGSARRGTSAAARPKPIVGGRATARSESGAVPSQAASVRNRVRLTGQTAAASPSKVGEVIRPTVAAVLCTALAWALPYAQPSRLQNLHSTVGVDTYMPFAVVSVGLVAAVVLLVMHAARWGLVSLFVTALATLVLAVTSGIVSLVLGAPGVVGGTVRMVALFALPWAAIVVGAGFASYALGRAWQLLRMRGARLLGAVFSAAALVCVGAAVWMVRLPWPTVASVTQVELVPIEAATRDRARQLAATLAGARGLWAERPATEKLSPRSGGAAAAALHRPDSP